MQFLFVCSHCIQCILGLCLHLLHCLFHRFFLSHGKQWDFLFVLLEAFLSRLKISQLQPLFIQTLLDSCHLHLKQIVFGLFLRTVPFLPDPAGLLPRLILRQSAQTEVTGKCLHGFKDKIDLPARLLPVHLPPECRIINLQDNRLKLSSNPLLSAGRCGHLLSALRLVRLFPADLDLLHRRIFFPLFYDLFCLCFRHECLPGHRLHFLILL